MRHLKKGRKLNRTASHRLALMRNLVTSLLREERIQTTEPKAKEVRGWVDRVIGLGKEGTLHARRRALGIVRDEAVVHKLFDTLAPRYKERPGGYTRIIKLGWRRGDRAPISMVELIPGDAAGKAETVSNPKKKIRRSANKEKEEAAKDRASS